MDYNSLFRDIVINAQRTDTNFLSQVPSFIERATARIYTEIDNLGIEQVVTENDPNYRLRANNQFVLKKADWKKTLSLSYVDPNSGLTIPLLPYSYEAALAYWPNPALTGTPLFYVHYNAYNYTAANMQFYIAPTPSFDANLVHVYIANPLFGNNNTVSNAVPATPNTPALVRVPAAPGVPTNAITLRYPDVIFYGAMLQAMTFLKDDNRIAAFDKMYTSALGRTNVEDRENFVDRTVKREEG